VIISHSEQLSKQATKYLFIISKHLISNTYGSHNKQHCKLFIAMTTLFVLMF